LPGVAGAASAGATPKAPNSSATRAKQAAKAHLVIVIVVLAMAGALRYPPRRRESTAPVCHHEGVKETDDEAAEAGAALLETLAATLRGRRVVVLTGAGCSTESGIPVYRGPGRAGPPRTPILHDAFLRRQDVRQRYWARATLGWTRFSGAAPNPAHHALAALETAGAVTALITQNVDRLHHRAGSRKVVELHGALEDVSCLACKGRHARTDIHDRLCAANPDWLARAVDSAPDGDAQLEAAEVAAFQVLPCPDCGGVLKPDVVFFGGTVPPDVVATAYAAVDGAEALLVVGSSLELEVYSGFRFVRHAAGRGIPVAILNQGPTRGDALAAVRVAARAGAALPALAARLAAG
jgi:NAD-dependent SIR2 family protein deacetylase